MHLAILQSAEEQQAMRSTYLFHAILFLVSYGVFFFIHLRHTQNDLSTVAALIPVAAQVLAQSSAQPANKPKVTQPKQMQQISAGLTPLPVLASPLPTASPDVFVPDYSSPQARIAALEHAVHDESEANRLFAVRELLALATSGVKDAAITEALRYASMDGDAEVQRAGEAAFREVTALQSSR